MLIQILLYLSSFLAIWVGSGLIVSSMDNFSKKLRLSSFIISFLILGVLTSVPEFAVGLTAIKDGDPEIFVGNLLGGIPVIFLFIIPTLAILGNGIELKHELNTKKMLATMAVILTPSLLILDKRISNPEGIIIIIMYIMLIFLIQRKQGFLSLDTAQMLNAKLYSPKDILKLIGGIALVFISSQIIVEQTLLLSNVFNVSPFFLSLLLLSLGTNLPELSLALRSVFLGKKDVAFGDYMGSAAANSLIFGVLVILNAGDVLIINNFTVPFFFIVLSLILFFFFARSNNSISRLEGIVLLCVYIIFVLTESFL